MNPSDPLEDDLFDEATGGRELDGREQLAGEIPDAMFDWLLAESLGNQSPPDFTNVILDRWHQSRLPVTATDREAKVAVASTGTTSKQRWTWAIAIAASILIISSIALVQSRRSLDRSLAHLSTPTEPIQNNDAPGRSFTGSPPMLVATRPAISASESNQPKPLTPIEMTVADTTQSPNAEAEPRSGRLEAGRPAVTGEPESIQLVSRQLDSRWGRYWQRIGATPTPMLSAADRAARLRATLGIELDDETLSDPETLAARLRQPKNAQAISLRLLASMTLRPASSLMRDGDLRNVVEFAKRLTSGRDADTMVTRWLTDGSWAELISPISEHQRVVATARVSAGEDLRCSRCHDLATSGGSSSQSDYWKFTALVSPLIQSTRRGSGELPPVFYERSDGRQALASPGVPESWSDAHLDQPIDAATWASDLKGSKSLAEGFVATMWRMVHGRPLVAGPFDLSAAPQDPLLADIESLLVDDLLAHRFDLIRTLSLLLTDPVMGRSPSPVMQPDASLTADPETWASAAMLVDAFAAATTEAIPIAAAERIKIARRELQSRLDRDIVLAQPSERPAGKFGPAVPRTNNAPEQLPQRASLVTPAWLGKLPDFESRLSHVAMLADRGTLRPDERELVEAMRASSNDESLLWQRVWWLLGPSSR